MILLSKCAMCNRKKKRFIKKQKESQLLTTKSKFKLNLNFVLYGINTLIQDTE